MKQTLIPALVLLSLVACEAEVEQPTTFRPHVSTTYWDIYNTAHNHVHVGDATVELTENLSTGDVEIALVLDISGSTETHSQTGLECGDPWTTGRFDQPDGGWVFFAFGDVCVDETHTVDVEDEVPRLQALQIRQQL
jgi:hypothetical protein